jgi:hypothetical protein
MIALRDDAILPVRGDARNRAPLRTGGRRNRIAQLARRIEVARRPGMQRRNAENVAATSERRAGRMPRPARTLSADPM